MKIVEKYPTMERFDYIVNRWKEQLIQCQTDTNELVFRLSDFVQTELDINRIKSNRWIPCSERMPLGGRVLATTKQGYVVDVIFVVNGSQWFRNGEYFPTDTVIAWMPMPDAYKPPESEVQ